MNTEPTITTVSSDPRLMTAPQKIPQRQRCSHASRYKATRAPKCGCVCCERKWAQRNVARIPRVVTVRTALP